MDEVILSPARMRSEGYCSRSCVCVCVCACVLPASVCPPFFSVTAATLSVKRGNIIK